MSEPENQAPPAGEGIHLPAPTLIPVVNALGITLIVIGTTISLLVSAVGAVVFLLSTVRWIRETRRDIAALPDEHH